MLLFVVFGVVAEGVYGGYFDIGVWFVGGVLFLIRFVFEIGKGRLKKWCIEKFVCYFFVWLKSCC